MAAAQTRESSAAREPSPAAELDTSLLQQLCGCSPCQVARYPLLAANQKQLGHPTGDLRWQLEA
jgi:hypothetical protein